MVSRAGKGTRASAARVLIRRALPSDCGFVRQLSAEAFSEFGEYEELLAGWLRTHGVLTLIAERPAGVPSGLAMVGLRARLAGFGRPAAELLAIAVSAQCRGQGIGSALIARAEHEARARGACRLELSTADTNMAAQRFFRRAGYVRSARRGGVYPAGQRAIIMVKEL